MDGRAVRGAGRGRTAKLAGHVGRWNLAWPWRRRRARGVCDAILPAFGPLTMRPRSLTATVVCIDSLAPLPLSSAHLRFALTRLRIAPTTSARTRLEMAGRTPLDLTALRKRTASPKNGSAAPITIATMIPVSQYTNLLRATAGLMRACHALSWSAPAVTSAHGS